VAEISREQRARLAWLMAQVTDHGGAEYLTAGEHKDLLHLLQIAGLIPDTPPKPPPKSSVSQPISGRSALRQLDELRAGWHNPPMSGKQAQLELLRMRGYWHMTPRQIQLAKIRESWNT
jgi:hypothetical protein